jgi:DNA-binding CsgD family transcriptional regulator
VNNSITQSVEEINVTKHPCMQATQDILPIIEPLEKINITHFSYIKRYKDMSHIVLTNIPKFSETFIKEKFYQRSFCGPFESYSTKNILGRDLGYDEVSQALEEQEGMGNLFIMLRKHNDYLESFFFGSYAENESINQFYINNQDLLAQYSDFFKEQAKPVIERCEKTRLLYPNDSGDKTLLTSDAINTITEADIEQFKYTLKKQLPNTNDTHAIDSITQRELECLHWQSLGKTAEEVAIIMSIAPRTVKAHVRNLKDKLGCINQFQLGAAYTKLKSHLELRNKR